MRQQRQQLQVLQISVLQRPIFWIASVYRHTNQITYHKKQKSCSKLLWIQLVRKKCSCIFTLESLITQNTFLVYIFRFWNVRWVFASAKCSKIRTLFWSPPYKKCDCSKRCDNKSHLQSPSTWKSHGMIPFEYLACKERLITCMEKWLRWRIFHFFSSY